MRDQERFVRNIAAGMLAGEWTTSGLRTSAHLATRRRYRWVPALAKRVLAEFTAPPAFEALVAFLQLDTQLGRVLENLARKRDANERFPRWHLFPAPTTPPVPRPAWAHGLPSLE